MSFEFDLRRITDKAKGDIDRVVQKVTMSVFRSVILKTPVDTGRARGNWMASVGEINSSINPSIVDKAGSQALTGAAEVALKTPAGNVVYLANSLPYIRSLEYGHSKQAPAGMVRVTAEEFRRMLNEVAGSR